MAGPRPEKPLQPRPDKPVFLHHRLEELARGRPDSTALTQDAKPHTFAELDGLANHVAWELTRRLPGFEALIAVWSADPVLQLILTLGVWKAGLTAMILDGRDSQSRLRWILGHADADAVIADTASPWDASQLGSTATVLLIDPGDTVETAPASDVSPDAPALVVFTSGSEGNPKGVTRTYLNVLLQAQRNEIELELGSNDRVAQLYPLNFSSGLSRALATLLNGSTLCFYDILSQGLTPFYEWFRREEITVMPSPVAFFRRAMHHVPDLDGFASCRYVMLSGEKIFKGDVDSFRRVFPKGTKLVYAYGATECGFIARHVIRHDTPVADPIPVGVGVDGKEIRIVSHGLREMPVGEMGLIAVLGSDLPPGYWKDPKATGEKYKPSPDNDGRSMCLTGDVGKIDENGLLYLYRRNDKQLKVDGYRVDLSEIEAALNANENVVHAVVMTTEEGVNDIRIVAYVTFSDSHDDGQVLVRALREATAARLPTYMVPDEFVVLDVIPTNSRGKIDRRALSKAPFPAGQAHDEEASTETEKKVLEVWREIFRNKELSLNDDILDLGIKSLGGMEMCLVLGRTFSIDIPFAQLPLSPTARQLAAFIDLQLAGEKRK